jgi:putative DNA primase/helicase
VVDRALLRRLRSDEGQSIYHQKFDCSGIWFANFWPGEPDKLRPSQLRLDKPHGKMRYLTEPERGNHLYIVPGTPAEWPTDTSLPIAVTEGPKKTLSLAVLALHSVENPRWLALGLNGINSWRDNRVKEVNAEGERVSVSTPIADLDHVKWQGRIVIIIFDANVLTSRQVRSARESLKQHLIGRGAVVEYVDLPEIDGVNGIDDLHFLWGPDKTLEYIDQARKRKSSAWGAFQVNDDGVYFIDDAKGPMCICGPLYITAATRSPHSDHWGRLLEWRDKDDKPHSWAMPIALLSGAGEEYRRRLLHGGLYVGMGIKQRERLGLYLQTQCPATRVTCVDRIGWHDGTFVLPNTSIPAPGAERVIFQSDAEPDHRLDVRGTATEWREHVGKLCSGNSRLVLAASTAFASPLLEPVGQESGGIHLVGSTSTGKTTTLVAAGSVLGGGGKFGYVETWRTTANGIEATAETHNDLLLVLDEIGQLDPHDAADAAYLLANGQGKGRMTRTIVLRRRLGWRLLFLSAGELTLADHSASAGRRTRGGAEVRLLNIDADAGAGMGLFQDLHGCASGDAFAGLLKERAQKYYGAPIRAFIENVVKRRAEIVKLWRDYRNAFVSEYVKEAASGEVKRAAERLALIAYAGEIATQWGITGWTKDESKSAAGSALQNWIQTRGGTGQADDETALRQVRRFIEANGASRFELAERRQDKDGNEFRERVVNRAGYREPGDDGEYWILLEVWRIDVCAGLDYKAVARVIDKAGFYPRAFLSSAI